MQTGARFEQLIEDDDGVTVTVRDRRTGEQREYVADVVAGADGLHSAVRAQMHPGGTALHHAGIRLWRGVCETDRFLDGRTMVVVGSNAHPRFVAYPVSRPADDPVEGVRAYSAARREVTGDLVLATRSNPADVYMRLVEERAPDGFTTVEDVLDRDELDAMAATYRRITHADVGQLSTRPSYGMSSEFRERTTAS